MMVPLTVAPLEGDKIIRFVFPTGVGVADGVGVGAGVGVGVRLGVGVGPGVGVMTGVGVTTGLGVAVERLLTVTATETVARTALLVENASITSVCCPSGTVVVSKLILHLPPDGEHTFPLPAPSG